MPWNRIYYPAGSLTQSDKNAIGKGITDIYAESYPASGTLVAFIPVEEGSFFKDGKVTTNQFRITLQFMAGTYNTNDLENKLRPRFWDVWRPYITDKGHTFELQMEEIPSPEISFDNFHVMSILADPLYQEMIKGNEVFPLKSVKG